MTSLKLLTFLLGSMIVTLIVLLFWTYLFLLMLVFVLKWLFLHWQILVMLLSQFPLTFCQFQNRMPHLTALLLTILALIGIVFMIIWEMVHGRISLNKVILLLLLVNFVSEFRLELMYVSLTESYCHSSQKSLFCLHQRYKSSESQVNLRQASNCSKRVLEAANLIIKIAC